MGAVVPFMHSSIRPQYTAIDFSQNEFDAFGHHLQQHCLKHPDYTTYTQRFVKPHIIHIQFLNGPLLAIHKRCDSNDIISFKLKILSTEEHCNNTDTLHDILFDVIDYADSTRRHIENILLDLGTPTFFNEMEMAELRELIKLPIIENYKYNDASTQIRLNLNDKKIVTITKGRKEGSILPKFLIHFMDEHGISEQITLTQSIFLANKDIELGHRKNYERERQEDISLRKRERFILVNGGMPDSSCPT